MNLVELQQKLIAIARANPPADSVPYAFEKRIMARLAGQTVQDHWSIWGQAFSRAAVFSVAFMLLLAGGSFFVQPPASNSVTLSQDVEQTLFAAVDNSSTVDQDAR